MKKIFSLLLVPAIALALTACDSSGSQTATTQTPPSTDESSSQTPETVPSSTPTPPPAPSTEQADRMVGIAGSYIKDIQLGVANFGMEDDSAQGAPDGAPYRWTATKTWNFPETTISLDYSIIGDDDSQLISGSFGATWDAVSSNDVFCAAAETYLGFIATMPYDTSDATASKQWVSDHIGSIAGADPISTTIGDAQFTLSGTATPGGEPSSFLLQIQVVE